MVPEPVILVAIDFSEGSEQALRQASRLAPALGAKVVLVHCFTPPVRVPSLATTLRDGPYVPVLEAEADLQVDEALDLTERWAKPLRDEGIEVDIIAEGGMPTELIMRTAEDLDPELIILGRQGRGRIRRFVVGSGTRYISEHSQWPVLIVPTS